MEKIKSWEERRAEQERKEKRKALTPIVSVVMLMFMFLMFSCIFFVEANYYRVIKNEDITVISAEIEKVDFREYNSLTNEEENTKWATVSTSYGKFYYDFYNETKMEEDKNVLLRVAEADKKVNLSIVSIKIRRGEAHQFIIDMRDEENVYFSLEDYNEYQSENRSKNMIIGAFITATTIFAGTIAIIAICKKASSGEKNGKRNRKSN